MSALNKLRELEQFASREPGRVFRLVLALPNGMDPDAVGLGPSRTYVALTVKATAEGIARRMQYRLNDKVLPLAAARLLAAAYPEPV